MRIAFLSGVSLCLALPVLALADAPAVLPNPASIESRPGHFRLDAKTVIAIPANDAEAPEIAQGIATILKRERGLAPRIVTGEPRDGAINLRRVMQPLRVEGYRLEVTPARVTIEASGWSGLYYGGVTLAQLAPAGRGAAAIPAAVIEDAPRFRWRGLMLDSARHYQSPAFIKRFVDAMAMHKLNVLHWHLTDDQAWRLEIAKYPKLTSVGAWRVPAGAAAKADIDKATGKPRRQGGFYTQKQVHEIVTYAALRGITVVPEIEMPGHATAAIAAYPWLAAIANPPREVPADWGVYPHAYNYDEKTFRFLEDVLDEVVAMFPSGYVHVGGDEVEKGQWRDSPAAQARMKALGVTDAAKLQGDFTQRMARYLEARKRRLVGWDEILEPGLPPKAVVMSWRGIDGALGAAAKGYDTVLAAHPVLYFDNRQSGASDEPPGRGTVITLKDVYAFEPMPPTIAPDKRRHVLGLQGQLWSEHIRTEERMAHMAFPRAAAIAELGWSNPDRREWRDFLRRVAAQQPRYAALGIPAADSAFAPRATIAFGAEGARVTLANQGEYGDLRYTLDGREPSAKSPRYEEPFTTAAGGTLRVAAFDGERAISRARSVSLAPASASRRASQDLTLCSQDIALSLEDDAPLQGPRAAFLVDIQNPCWLYKDAALDGVTAIAASVGQIPFNFQIGEAVKKIAFAKPETAAGELLVSLGCGGEVIARLPLAPATASQAVTALPPAKIAARGGRADLCLRFAQPTLEPMWVVDSIELRR